ncbi:tyrosine-type recombinase/integrase [Paracoccus beibuensis]|uniref:tyrosine-type recombinase/integrase n=1 Tax=Paracoccus beibuensis TaxID=547602 RepID=UPI00223EF06F|nr:tyrosine-type recombinase/integrase [Paracoccus beibuensis]
MFFYLDAQNVKQSWDSVVRRAGIKRLTPHSCRDGFATIMLHAGFDVKTVAEMGGWMDAGIVLKHYAHAIKDRTVTDAIFATNPTQEAGDRSLSHRNIKGKGA